MIIINTTTSLTVDKPVRKKFNEKHKSLDRDSKKLMKERIKRIL